MATALEVSRLLLQGTPQRAVARLLGVSRNTVQRIAAGCWAPRMRTKHPLEPVDPTPAPSRRCQSCGSQAHFSGERCYACSVRASVPSQPRDRVNADPVPVDWETTEPTPNEIRAACQRIQTGWTAAERRRRREGVVDA